MSYGISQYRNQAKLANEFKDLQDIGVDVVDQTSSDPTKTESGCETPRVRVPIKAMLEKMICDQLMNRMDLQKMTINNIEQSNLKMLYAQLKENRFEVTKSALGNKRICEGRAGLISIPFVYNNVKKIFIEAVEFAAIPDYVFGKMVYCQTVSIDEYKHTTGFGKLYTTYSMNKGKCIIKTEGRDTKTDLVIDRGLWSVEFKTERVLDIPFIPVTEFKNNWRGYGEFIGFEKFMEEMENNFYTLGAEVLTGKTLITLNTLLLNDDAPKIISAIKNGESFLEIQQADASFGNAVTSIATQGKIQEFWTLFQDMKSELISLMSLPTDFVSEGKNNKHNKEIAQATASARVNIESKRNLIHEAYEEFFKKLLHVNKYYGVIPFNKEDTENFELMWEDAQAEEDLKVENKETNNPKEEE